MFLLLADSPIMTLFGRGKVGARSAPRFAVSGPESSLEKKLKARSDTGRDQKLLENTSLGVPGMHAKHADLHRHEFWDPLPGD